MTRVKFYDPSFSPGAGLIYSVIAARFEDRWIFVRHHERDTWEIAGGHIEKGESPDKAARRELIEETGASQFDLVCIGTYSVEKNGTTDFGKLYFAEVLKLIPVPDNSEIAEIILSCALPENLTYPDIQPRLFNKVTDFLKNKG